MAIVQTLNKYSFIEAFKQSSRKDQFSHEALEAIFYYLEEYSEGSGENVELDIVSICCDWTKADWKTVAEDYKIDLEGCDDDEERIEAVRDYLEYETQCVELSEGSFVYVNF